jgi:hypothetical protein
MKQHMTDEQINVAIAEACGWKGCLECNDPICEDNFIPNYCNDLNAMNEAEKTLSPSDLWTMKYYLPFQGGLEFRSTARQRAEAFLRTLDKWEALIKHEN